MNELIVDSFFPSKTLIEWVRDYDQNVSETYLESLVGKYIRVMASCESYTSGFECFVIGYAKEVVVGDFNTKAFRWSILSDEGISYYVTTSFGVSIFED
jgi:hypothetical protein